MLKSLFSGVSGLQSHQVAMDVESNNIANVNTVGYKYSRANFSDLLAQTQAIATAPQGSLGGKNAVQVGLGSTVSSMTRIFSQGSVQNTDKNTDVAIQGDGFFIVSPDGGNTYKYTRAGDFKFDAGGNFVDNNGFIAQGWGRDDITGNVDATAPITNINIPPGLTTPANPSSQVVLKANLNSGPIVTSFSPAFEVSSGIPNSITNPGEGDAVDDNANAIASGNMGVMFSETGEAFALQQDQGVWVSFLSSQLNSLAVPASTGANDEINISFTLDDGTTSTITSTGATGLETSAENANRYISAINAQTGTTGIEANYDAINSRIQLVNTNENASASHNIRLISNTGDNSGFSTSTSTTAYRYQYDSTGPLAIAGQDKKFTTIADLRYAMEIQARSNNFISTSSTTVTAGTTATDNALDITIGGLNVTLAATGAASTADANGASYAAAINGTAGMSALGIVASYNVATDQLTLANTSAAAVALTTTDAGQSGMSVTSISAVGDLDGDGISNESNIEIIVNEQGKIRVSNPGGSDDGDYDMNIKVTAISGSGITANTNFTRNMEAMNAVLPVASGGLAFTQGFNAATHSSSIDIFDSLGSKHTLRMEFRKTALDVTTGSTWDMVISVPQPATIDTIAPTFEKTGSVRFNNDGSLATYSPPNISFSGNNGSAPNQQVNIEFGAANAFDGVTSFDSVSATSGISQDGFTGGDLVGIRIDQSGTLVGSFSNGRSFGLAQIAMSKFTNNEGLTTEGGNVYVQTANSGDPIIGTAATAGRGYIQSSALEASNVDLSKSLTELIIVQRGFQANGKTITTSDQMLQTLIQLKN